MTRRPAALDPSNPTAAFAVELRALRDRLGGDAPTIDEVSALTKIPRSTLYAALRGQRLPSRKVLVALVQAWNGNEAEWLSKRSAVEALLETGAEQSSGRGLTGASPAGEFPIFVGRIPTLPPEYQHRREFEESLEKFALDGSIRLITGLGGVGKTQLAAVHARSILPKVDLLMWISAVDRQNVLASFAEASARLGHPQPDDQERAAYWFLGWLQSTRRTWCVVLDDLQRPGDLAGIWPDGPTGQVLVTTRRLDTSIVAGRSVTTVSSFTHAEAVQLLSKMLGAAHGDARLDEADELVTELGHLPLAISQAAAFMIDRNESCKGYRERLRDANRSLVELFPPDSLSREYRDTLSAVLTLTVDAADDLPPKGLAGHLLKIFSLLDSSVIPLKLIEAESIRSALEALSAPPIRRPLSDIDLRDGISNLRRLSLAEVEQYAGLSVARIHPLLQRFISERFDDATLNALSLATAQALESIWPHDDRGSQLAEILRANVRPLIEKSGDALWQGRAHEIIWRAGASIANAGLVGIAVDYWSNLLVRAELHLGPDNPDTLTIRHNFATWRAQVGDHPGAVETFERLLADRIRVLGPDHPDTLTTRHNLAFWRGQAGDPRGAATALQQLLADRLRVLGPGHPDTLTTRHNLASLQAQAGDPHGAATAFEQLLADRLRVLGPDHPDTLTTRNNLAFWRGQAGDPQGAATAFEQLLTDRLRVLGPDHPDTLTTRHNLATWRGQAGDPQGAATAFEQLLTDRLRVLGPDHPDTLTTRHNLATWRGQAGDPNIAVSDLQRLHADLRRVLGEDHPVTRASVRDLSSLTAEKTTFNDDFRLLIADALGIVADLRNTRAVTSALDDAAIVFRTEIEAAVSDSVETRLSVASTMLDSSWVDTIAAEVARRDKIDRRALRKHAQRLIELAAREPQGRSGTYSIDARGSQGVQVGDHNSQTNTFGMREI